MVLKLDPENLRILGLERTADLHIAPQHGRDTPHIRETAHRIHNDLRLLDALDVFHPFALADLKIGTTRHLHAAQRVLDAILDTHRAIGAEERLHEKFLEAARRRLRDDKQANPQHRAGQAHQHGPFFRCEKTESDTKIRRHQKGAIISLGGDPGVTSPRECGPVDRSETCRGFRR